jgi:hypothetical protein
LADRVSQVLHELVDQINSPHIAAILFSLLEAYEFAERGVARFPATHAGGDVFINLALEVIPQFFVELRFDPAARDERPNPQSQNAA